VPGPREALYFAGQKIENFMFWVPRSGKIGLGISIISYDGKVTVGIASDEGLMADPEILLEGFEEEFNSLLALVQSGKIYDEPLVLHDRYTEARSAADTVMMTDVGEEKSQAPCKALSKTGIACKNKALADSDYCRVHQQKAEEEMQLQDVAKIMRELTN